MVRKRREKGNVQALSAPLGDCGEVGDTTSERCRIGRTHDTFFFRCFHLLDASSAHTLARLALDGVLLVDVLHRALDVPVRLERLAILILLPLLHRF